MLQLNSIDEAVDRGQLGVFHRGDEFAADFDAGFELRQGAVRRQVVPGEGDLLCVCGDCKCSEDDYEAEGSRIGHRNIIYRGFVLSHPSRKERGLDGAPRSFLVTDLLKEF